ncbi:hypothetical protein [Kocuria rhizophila]|uniref:hypothetical protein n=1 Tax=Kocuria rhizophila TaxID=72000 RepID=UPI00190D6209|nr:hypothetical protein [Kocuria rhizophila]MBK4119734.1 hypothetical protein [Kocuria rhizophila]
MPQRQNLKPALADTLRQLRNDVQSGATVPHGVKTVQPGEGLQLVPPEGGAEIFWDWETANSVEQRIQDGTALIDQTRATLAQTEQELQSAQDRIGRVAAGEIEKIDGHIIINGTVDLPALNVTGEMASTLVKALDVEARRGIFTEGLTAQDSVLLGTTMAEAINAGEVATRIMTSGLLQTTTAANRGVKVDNNGIRAWDDAGRQTVNLNGKANYITGTFATAEKEQRVEIKSGGSVAAADFYGSGNTVDHLGVWHQADAGVNTVSKIVSQPQAKMQDGNPGLLMYPIRGEFAFRGRWAKESDTVKFVKLKGAGLPAGGWIDLRITYVFPFSSLYSDLHTIVSAESWSGQEILATVITNARDQLLVRLVNKSSKDSGTVILHAAAFNVNSVAGYTEYA